MNPKDLQGTNVVRNELDLFADRNLAKGGDCIELFVFARTELADGRRVRSQAQPIIFSSGLKEFAASRLWL